jgi:hypothetical protein
LFILNSYFEHYINKGYGIVIWHYKIYGYGINQSKGLTQNKYTNYAQF